MKRDIWTTPTIEDAHAAICEARCMIEKLDHEKMDISKARKLIRDAERELWKKIVERRIIDGKAVD